MKYTCSRRLGFVYATISLVLATLMMEEDDMRERASEIRRDGETIALVLADRNHGSEKRESIPPPSESTTTSVHKSSLPSNTQTGNHKIYRRPGRRLKDEEVVVSSDGQIFYICNLNLLLTNFSLLESYPFDFRILSLAISTIAPLPVLLPEQHDTIVVDIIWCDGKLEPRVIWSLVRLSMKLLVELDSAGVDFTRNSNFELLEKLGVDTWCLDDGDIATDG
ncbi:hypothetical protein L2E82_08101 [Cichorium intybus]|uniref:Uncharacterized protein n=1 Tax=Cichorium intybus TaxID=13427 RepID=A0ACB9G5J4_CICIN|nr:hypothetical protein L2E82_08101 [Cichorium intybus]